MRRPIALAFCAFIASATAGEADNWPAGGRDQEGTYYSPLTQINSKNIDELGFAWSYDLGTTAARKQLPLSLTT